MRKKLRTPTPVPRRWVPALGHTLLPPKPTNTPFSVHGPLRPALSGKHPQIWFALPSTRENVFSFPGLPPSTRSNPGLLRLGPPRSCAQPGPALPALPAARPDGAGCPREEAARRPLRHLGAGRDRSRGALGHDGTAGRAGWACRGVVGLFCNCTIHPSLITTS